MDKIIIIFGADGALGKGVTKTLLSKDYDEVYLFDFKFERNYSEQKVKQFIVKDLSIENNVLASMLKIKTDEKTQLFLFSTIGGYYGGAKIWETEEKDFDRMFAMNLKSNFFIAKHFASLIKKSYSGSICFTSAYTGNNPEQLKFVYGASKSALNYLTKTLALEGREINLTANAIAPFIIDTPANREWMKNVDYSSWIKPEEIGELVHSIFVNHNFASGNVIELKQRFNK